MRSIPRTPRDRATLTVNTLGQIPFATLLKQYAESVRRIFRIIPRPRLHLEAHSTTILKAEPTEPFQIISSRCFRIVHIT